MLYYIGVAFVLLYLGIVALLESICASVSLSLCLKLNVWITTTFARRLMALLKSCMGLTFLADSAEKERLPERCLVIANHQSFLDILMLLSHLDGRRLKFIARAALGSNFPLIAPMLRSDGHCLIDKNSNVVSDTEAIDEFAQNVKEHNWMPVLFPEGVCSRDGRVGEFHAAGFRRLVESTKLPVAVFAIDGGWQYSDVGGLIRALRHGPSVCRIKLLAVYPAPSGRKEQKRILSEARELICRQLEEWRSGQE